MTHTKTPWHVVENGLAGYGDNGPNFFICAEGKGKSSPIAVMSLTHKLLDYGETPRYKQTKEDAAFICRAVNSHERMVEALENLIAAADAHVECADAVDAAKAALAAAKGE